MEMIGNFEVCENLDICLSQLDQNSKLAVAISREYVRRIPSYLASQIYCFDKSESLHSYALTFLIRNGFNYTQQLNTFIRRASMGGFVERWRSNSNIQTRYEREEKVYNQFELNHFFGSQIFGILIVAMAVSALFLERLIHTKARESSSSQFWSTVEKLIDSERRFMIKNRGLN